MASSKDCIHKHCINTYEVYNFQTQLKFSVQQAVAIPLSSKRTNYRVLTTIVGPDQLCRNPTSTYLSPTSTKLNCTETYCMHKRSMPNAEEPDLSHPLSFIALDGCSSML